MGLLERPNKRRCFPVQLEDRTVYVRSLLNAELSRLTKLDKQFQNAFFLGKALVSEDGTPEVPQNAGEADQTFAERVIAAFETAEVDGRIEAQLISAVTKVTRYDPDEISKN